MELWDAYDEKLNKIEGLTLVRGQKIPENVYHMVCDILVQHRDGSYLLMQRSSGKHFGGMWEASAAGSALQGEDSMVCAIRELYEETGIKAQELKELGKIIHPAHRSIYAAFLAVTDCDKASVILRKGETMAFQWVSRDTLVHMSREELITDRVQVFLPELRR